MKPLSTAVLIFSLIAAQSLHGAQARDLLQSIINQPDDKMLPNIQQTVMSIDASGMSADETRSALPLALQCLQSPRASLKPYGVDFMFSVALRPDGAQMLEPYLDGLAPFLGDADHAFRRTAIAIMGNSNPKPSASAVKYLSVHLSDPANTEEEVGLISAGILRSVPDKAVVRMVLDLVETRRASPLTSSVIGMLGLYRIQTDDALTFIRRGFSDSNPGVRKASVDAVSRMPPNLLAGFRGELQHILQDPNENAQTKAQAITVLTGVR